MKNAAALALLLALSTAPALAMLDPRERLDDPALEARARSLSSELRCMVCQNQSIDDSDAELARDLRVLVRERIAAGDTDREVLDYVVSRYGEFVLLRPPLNARNLALWGTPIALILAGATFMLVTARRRRGAATAPLSADEQRRLDALLKRDSAV